MSIIRKYIRNRNFVLTIVRDKVDDEMLMAHVNTLTKETKDMHSFLELVDASEINDVTGITESGIVLAASCEYDRIPYVRGKLAIMVSSEQIRALAQKYKLISNYYRYDVQIFEEFQPAVASLGLADIENEINELRK